jgi:hypothetical protein
VITDQVVNNVELALFHANMIAQFKSVNPKSNMDSILNADLQTGFSSFYAPAEGEHLAVYYGGNAVRKIMYIDGLANGLQGNALIAGYGPQNGLQFVQGPNLWARRNVPYYQSIISSGRIQNTEFLDFVGYSAGGVQATVICDYLRTVGNVQKKKLFTFGSPRAGTGVMRDRLSRFPIARWMVPDDPIPLVPPRIDEGPNIAFIAPTNQVLAWASMVHTQGGVEVDANGATLPRITPSAAIADPVGNIAAWLFSKEGDPNNPHAIQRYISNLEAANRVLPLPRQKSVRQGPVEAVEIVKRREVDQVRERINGAIANAQHQQFRAPIIEPKARLFVPVRLGRIWNVEFGGRIVAQGVHEKTCRHICRAGNDLLRSLPKQGLVDVIALMDQFEQFLGFAASPDSAWSPKIRTEIDFSA